MPSPFPGMNPYLEHEFTWQDFHDTLLPAMRRALTPQLSPRYIVKIEEHLFIHEPSAEQTPARVRIPSVDFEKHLFLEIRDREGLELVTVLEVLTPTNKRPGPDREQYLAKRANLLRSAAHFVEIDLLRAGPRMPMEPLPGSEYCVLLSRVEERPEASIWPLRLREPLPRIPVPLRAPSADVYLDLQGVLNTVYDEAGYKDYIYRRTPNPPLSPEDTAWAASILGN